MVKSEQVTKTNRLKEELPFLQVEFVGFGYAMIFRFLRKMNDEENAFFLTVIFIVECITNQKQSVQQTEGKYWWL